MSPSTNVVLFICAIYIIGGGFRSTIAQRDYGEPCKLRSQIANILRGESGDGCLTSKGLVCFNHKCICADPSNVYEIPVPDEPSGSSSSSTSSIASSVIGFIRGDKNKNQATTTVATTVAPAASGAGTGSSPGKCVGRAGSPCFTQSSTCVKHAICEGAPRMCKCQGIYGSNTSGYCSKTANVFNQVLKHGGSAIGK